MKRSFTKATRIAAAATALFVASVEAEDAAPPETESASANWYPATPGTVQPQVEPTVGAGPFFKPLEFRGTADLRETLAGKEVKEVKEVAPSERHWKFLLGITVGVDYDDNIFLAPVDKAADWVFGFAPTIGVQVGDVVAGSNYFLFTYTPTFVVFVDNSDQNSIEHAANLTFVRQTDIWKFSSNFDFLSLNGASNPLRDAAGAPVGDHLGERVDRQVYTLGLKYNYNVSDKSSFELGFSGTGTHYQAFLDTIDLVSQDFFDFAVTEKTSFGLGVGIGYAKTENSRDQIYEQALARIRYFATSKLAFEIHGGAEFRQVDGRDDQNDGVFGASVTFSPSERTQLSLSGYRNVNPSSFLVNTDYTTTGVRMSVSQQVHGKLSTSLEVGYEKSEYQTIGDNGALPNVRTDDYFYIRPAIQYRLGSNGAVEVFYEYRSNDSTLAFDDFDNNRVGVKVGFAF